MKNQKKQTYKILIGILILFLFLPSATLAVKPKSGDKAQNISGRNALDRTLMNLFQLTVEMDFKKDAVGKKMVDENGKYIMEFVKYAAVLNFFSKDCIPCLKEIPTFNKLEKLYKNKKVKFFYVNLDLNLPRSRIIDLVNNKGIQSPMMMLPLKEAQSKYGVSGLPHMVLIDKNRKIYKIITGFDEELESKLKKDLDILLSI